MNIQDENIGSFGCLTLIIVPIVVAILNGLLGGPNLFPLWDYIGSVTGGQTQNAKPLEERGYDLTAGGVQDGLHCGDVVQIKHPETESRLHSDGIMNPYEEKIKLQLATGYNHADTGSYWVIGGEECPIGQAVAHIQNVTLQHEATAGYLCSQGTFRAPIASGQQTVGVVPAQRSDFCNINWKIIFLAPNDSALSLNSRFTLQNKTHCVLHSHDKSSPKTSDQNEVTCYHADHDENNEWVIVKNNGSE